MARHEDSRERFGRLENVRDAMEVAWGHARGIEDDYRRGLLEAHGDPWSLDTGDKVTFAVVDAPEGREARTISKIP